MQGSSHHHQRDGLSDALKEGVSGNCQQGGRHLGHGTAGLVPVRPPEGGLQKGCRGTFSPFNLTPG